MLMKGSAWDGAGKHDPKPQAGLVSTGTCFPSPQMSAATVLCPALCFNDALPHVLAMGTFCKSRVLARFGFFI